MVLAPSGALPFRYSVGTEIAIQVAPRSVGALQKKKHAVAHCAPESKPGWRIERRCQNPSGALGMNPQVLYFTCIFLKKYQLKCAFPYVFVCWRIWPLAFGCQPSESHRNSIRFFPSLAHCRRIGVRSENWLRPPRGACNRAMTSTRQVDRSACAKRFLNKTLCSDPKLFISKTNSPSPFLNTPIADCFLAHWWRIILLTF